MIARNVVHAAGLSDTMQRMTITARQVADYFESVAPLCTGNPDDELGFIHGDPRRTIRGIGCVWNATSASIAAAAGTGLDMLIVHERIYYPAQESAWYDGPKRDEEIPVTPTRRGLRDRHGMVVYRSHSNWDALDGDGVPDQAVAALGLAGLSVVGGQKYFKVHESSRPLTLTQLAEAARTGLKMPWPPNVFRPSGFAMNRPFDRFSFLIGGFGANQYNMPLVAMKLGAQALIIGEMLEFTVIQALELGLPVIQTLHSLSEIPAIRRQAAMLAARFPELPVKYIDSGALGF